MMCFEAIYKKVKGNTIQIMEFVIIINMPLYSGSEFNKFKFGIALFITLCFCILVFLTVLLFEIKIYRISWLLKFKDLNKRSKLNENALLKEFMNIDSRWISEK